MAIIATEEWRAVVGCDGSYEVSSHGRVRSLDREVSKASRWGGIVTHKLKGRVLRKGSHPQGYLVVSTGRRRLSQLIHRLVAEAFIGPIPDGQEVNHIDGDKKNNFVGNLEYVTRKQNVAHAMITGLMPRNGENNPACVHSKEDILAAYQLVKDGATMKDAAITIGISVNTIYQVCDGTKWKSLGLSVIRRRARRQLPDYSPGL